MSEPVADIIDFHAHVAWSPLYDPRFVDALGERLFAGARAMAGHMPDAAKARALVAGLLNDRWCDNMVRAMDQAGIRRAVLLSLPHLADPAHEPMSMPAIYAHVAGIVDRHPGRFVPFAGVNPTGGAASINAFRHAVEDLGFRGLKLYPPMGYRPDDPRLEDCYALCAERGLTVLSHTGPSAPRWANEHAEPALLAELPRRWPRVTFVLAHAGYRLDPVSVGLAAEYPNVYLDIAGYQPRLSSPRADQADRLAEIFSEPLYRKVLFGTDWPLFHLFSTPRRDIEALRALHAGSRYSMFGERFSAVMGGNAAGIIALARQ